MDGLLPEIVASLQRHSCLVIEAQPGAGRTTRIPPALLRVVTGEILVFEPHRIVARLVGRQVAWEFGEAVGETVGYQVRFEEVTGPRTRLRFVTERILTRRLLTDPTLRGVDVVVSVRPRTGSGPAQLLLDRLGAREEMVQRLARYPLAPLITHSG